MSLINNLLLKSMSCYNFRLLSPFRFVHLTPVQHLYSPASLGIDGYLQNRKRSKEQFANFSDKFRTKLTELVDDPKNMIFTEDLKNIVHMAEPTDLDLVLKMAKKFNTQNTEFRFGSYVFGPVMMRMFHFLDAPKEALECFEDPANNGFFEQLASYHILLDLLYRHEMYDEMYRVFEKLQERQINMTKFPKYPVVLILAACYKQNTPKSLEYATKLWTEMTNVGTVPLRRACAFFAALALKQGAPHIALESLSMQRQHYVTIRNLKAVALAEMGRVDDVLPVLKGVLEVDHPDQKHTFFEETISKVREAVEKCSDKDLKNEFDNIEKALRDRNLIDEQTLDGLLHAEISRTRRPEPPRGMPSFQDRRPHGQGSRNYTRMS